MTIPVNQTEQLDEKNDLIASLNSRKAGGRAPLLSPQKVAKFQLLIVYLIHQFYVRFIII